MIRKYLPAYLLSQAAITNIVGQRVYPARAPQKDETDGAGAKRDVMPCVVFLKSPKPNGRTYGNDGHDEPVTSFIRVESLARGYGDAQKVAEAVRLVLCPKDGDPPFPGMMGDLAVSEVQLVDDFDEVDEEAGGNDEAIYATVQIFEILHASEVSDG